MYECTGFSKISVCDTLFYKGISELFWIQYQLAGFEMSYRNFDWINFWSCHSFPCFVLFFIVLGIAEAWNIQVATVATVLFIFYLESFIVYIRTHQHYWTKLNSVSLYLSLSLSLSVSLCLSVSLYLSLSLFVSLSVCLSVCLSVFHRHD